MKFLRLAATAVVCFATAVLAAGEIRIVGTAPDGPFAEGQRLDVDCNQQLQGSEITSGSTQLQWSQSENGPWTTATKCCSGPFWSTIRSWAESDTTYSFEDCLIIDSVWVRVAVWPSNDFNPPPTLTSDPIFLEVDPDLPVVPHPSGTAPAPEGR